MLWTSGSAPAPVILVGHNGGLHKRESRLTGRARRYAARYGFAVAAIDIPGTAAAPVRGRRAGPRRPAPSIRGRRAGRGNLGSFVGPLVEQAVPEWRATLDALFALPEIAGPVGYSGMTAIGIRLAVVEPRIRAAGFFAGVPCPALSAGGPAGQHSAAVPAAVGRRRQRRRWPWTCSTLSAPARKTLHANMGGHAGTPWFEVDAGAGFFARHLT